MRIELTRPRDQALRPEPSDSEPLESRQSLPNEASMRTIGQVDAPLLTRLATAADQALLVAWGARACLAAPGDRESPLAHPQRCERMGEQIALGLVMLAERGTQVLGFARIQARADGNHDIVALFVELDRWRAAVASLLVAHCADRARRLGARSLHVAGAPRTERFYDSCGFELKGLQMSATGVAHLLRMPLGRS